MTRRASDPKGGSLTHIPVLDGVRGLGVAGILLFHAGHWRGGWLGVDLVLSGFLITQIMLGEVERTGAVSLPQFWTRRARRLLRALFLLTLGVSVYAASWWPPRRIACSSGRFAGGRSRPGSPPWPAWAGHCSARWYWSGRLDR